MEELLKRFVEKKIDVSCGGAAVFRGRVRDVQNGILSLLDDDDREIFIAIEKIASVCECRDSSGRPGFLG